ncbi:MAG: hypothetical protein KHX26_02300 [Burkholderiales bacterium]|nr:hypothetical protein [Burkholderiales bacterium]QQQ98048.1 hypothetical protein I5Q81_09845 [Turicimonas muris]
MGRNLFSISIFIFGFYSNDRTVKKR